MPNGYIGQIHIDQTDYKIGSTLFAVLDTDESIGSITTIDSITTFNIPLNGFVLTNGVTIHIQFKQAWTDLNATALWLKIDNTDAKLIENPNGASIWKANSVISFTYDGEKYIMNTVGFDASSIEIDTSQLTNSYRPIRINGTEILSSSNSAALNLINGDNISVTNNSGTVTISNTYSLPLATNEIRGGIKIGYAAANKNYALQLDNNEKAYIEVPWENTHVTQNYSTTNNSYPILFSATSGITSTNSRGETGAILNNDIYANPSDGSIHATSFYGDGSNLTNITVGSIDWTNIQNVPTTLVTSVNGQTGPEVTITAGSLGLASALRFIGVTTSNIIDGWTGVPAGINNYTNPEVGDVVIKDDAEYVCISGNGSSSTWELLGRDSSFALDTEVIKKSDFTGAYQLIYSSNIGTPAYLNPNTSNVRKYLSMQGNDETGAAPTWEEINKSTLGLGNVTNHEQIHTITWDNTNKRITYSKNNTTTNLITFSQGGNIVLTATESGLAISATQFSGATKEMDGTAGYLAAPESSSYDKFLQGSGTWKTLGIPTIASVSNGVLTITNVALSVS